MEAGLSLQVDWKEVERLTDRHTFTAGQRK